MQTAITPTRADNYPEWYQQVIKAADLAENSPVRGCMVIKPWGYAIWELIQQDLDRRIKATGHVNAYFPLLIPLSYIEKEASHISGFAKECAVVTHHRLEQDEKGGLRPAGELEEPFIIRPTSETIIGESFSRWIESYRDLPLLINQWANVMRWEMRTRFFLRSSEFLWQEGHTAHATSEEAVEETLKMLGVYAAFAEEYLAMPVIRGEKPIHERFPGAVSTYCIEAMMQDGKALQAGTSHFLGQHFSKAYNIQFLDKDEVSKYVWTTSWGSSTRLIGGVIMTHSDDNGLVLPPNIAPHQVVILPIVKDEADKALVLSACESWLTQMTEKGVRGFIDTREMRGGEKKWHWIKKGVPIIIEVGKRDIESGKVFLLKRPTLEKETLDIQTCLATLPTILKTIQATLFDNAKKRADANMFEVTDIKAFEALFKDEKPLSPFVSCFAEDSDAVEAATKSLKATARCMPLDQGDISGKCIFTGKTTKRKMVFAKAY